MYTIVATTDTAEIDEFCVWCDVIVWTGSIRTDRMDPSAVNMWTAGVPQSPFSWFIVGSQRARGIF